jgi:phosphatidate cytidylyltransferase
LFYYFYPALFHSGHLKDIYIRTITGIFFLVAVIGSLLIHHLAFFALFFIFCGLAINEYYQMVLKGERRGRGVHFYLGGLIIYSLTGLIGLGYLDIRFAYLILLAFPLAMVPELFNRNSKSFKRVGIFFAGWLYIALPFGLMNALFLTRYSEDYFSGLLFGLFVIIWASDIFAYLIGSAIGKHRLFPSISPKKSWEGSFGGLVFGLIAAVVLSLVYPELSVAEWLIIALITIVAGTIGDLIESMIKREAGVKDSGKLLPGHGGILDRFDATIFAVPFIFVYVNLF